MMKVLIMVIFILSSYSLFSYQRIDIIYPNYQKYSLDNGNSWIKKHSQITITYPKYQKVSYDNGTTWTITGNEYSSFGVLTHSNRFDVNNVKFFDFKLKDYQSFSFLDKNFMVLESGPIIRNQLVLDLNEHGFYYLILNNRNDYLMIRILRSTK